MMTLDEIKLYCHIDGTDEDSTLDNMLKAAQDLIAQQSGKSTFVGSDGTQKTALSATPLYEIAVKQLVAHWYDHRGAADGVDLKDIPFAVDSIIAHFKYSEMYK